MELREWLIILGLILMAIIVIDGVRRLQRQRQSSRLDAGRAAQHEKSDDDIARQTEWELPNGGARVVKEATVQPPPVRQTSAFERKGLKTRIPESEAPSATVQAASVVDAARATPAVMTTTTTAAAETPADGARSAAAAEADAMTDAALMEASTSTQSEPAATDMSEPAPTHHQERVDRADDAPNAGDVADVVAQEAVAHDDEDEALQHDDEAQEDELAPEPFDVPEEEAVDDPRYEGLSEILWRRPLDGLAHMKEVLAERRERKAQAREEARVRRLEARARRAEEKEKRRAEKEAAQQQAREEALALQAQQREEDDRARAQQAARTHAHREDPLAPLDDDDPLFAPSSRRREPSRDAYVEESVDDAYGYEDDDYRDTDEPQQYAEDVYEDQDDEPEWDDRDAVSARHPDIERARRHLVNGTQARETLASASEVIAIAVMARDGETFDGMALLKLMLACGLRYCPTTRVFHRFETDDDNSPLQFSVIDTLKPGEFPLDEMDEFSTKGVWLLMPMPGANELSTAFEAMYETARAIARYLEGELRDENQSVITAQTVEFSRQRVQEFERRAKLYHASH